MGFAWASREAALKSAANIKARIWLMLFTYQMLKIFVVLVADVFEQVRIGQQLQRELHIPGLGISFRIVNGDQNIHISKILPPEALRYAQGVGGGTAVVIEPALIIETRGLRHEIVSLPMPDRITLPGRVRIFGKLAAIRENLAITMDRLIENDHHLLAVDNLERVGNCVGPRDAARNAVSGRIFLALG